jgi:glycosyltransferase involved in cell wall biosynthesis
VLRLDPPRVLSLTQAALSRDSRTLKAAMTYARLGLVSCVIEGRASMRSWQGWPIAVAAARRTDPPTLRRLGHHGLRSRRGGLAAFAVFAAYLAYFVYSYVVRPVPRMRRAALYHLHSFESYPLLWLWMRLFGGRYIYDIHDYYQDLDAGMDASPAQRRWIKPLHRAIERRCIAGAGAVITVSDGIAELVEASYGRRPEVVRNCHDFRLDRPPRQGLRESLALAQDRFVVAVVGNNKPGMATDAALAALALAPARTHIVFLGDGYEEVERTAAQSGLQGRVHFAGRLAPEEIVPFVASADAALIPYFAYTANYQAALPNGLFQALAGGLPVLYAGLPQIRKLMEPFAAGIEIDARSPEGMAAAISRLEGDAEECARQRAASRRVSAAVNFEHEERVLIGILERLFASGAAAPAVDEAGQA